MEVKEKLKDFALDWFIKGCENMGIYGSDSGVNEHIKKEFEYEWERNHSKITVEDHHHTPDQQVIEISDDRGLIATVIPKKREIVIVSKWITDTDLDMIYPQKVTIKIKRI